MPEEHIFYTHPLRFIIPSKRDSVWVDFPVWRLARSAESTITIIFINGVEWFFIHNVVYILI